MSAETTGMRPIPKPSSIMIWPSSQRNDGGQYHKSEHDKQFERRYIELNYTWKAMVDEIESHDDKKENRNPCTRVDSLSIYPI